MNRILSAAFFFAFLTHFFIRAAENITEYATTADLKKEVKNLASDLSPGPADIIGTGLMMMGSAMLIPYTCVPDANNPEMTRNKKAACAGSIIYVMGQTTDFFVKLTNLIRHL